MAAGSPLFLTVCCLLMEQELVDMHKALDLLDAELMVRTCEYRRSLQEKECDIARMMQTRSWRWTAPLRMGESFLRTFVVAWMTMTHSALRSLRRTMRSPMRNPQSGVASIPAVTTPPQASLSTQHDLRAAAVVLCHDCAHLLPLTLEHLLAQTQKFTEVLVVDDCSSDDIREVALRYAHSGVEYLHGVWRHEHQAKNAGCRSTEAPILVFLNGGEMLPRDYLSHCIAALRDHPSTAIVYPEQSSDAGKKHIPSPDTFDREHFEQENTLPNCSAVRRDAFLDVGGWNHGLGEHATWITWRRIIANGWGAVKIPCTVRCSSKNRPTCHDEPCLPAGRPIEPSRRPPVSHFDKLNVTQPKQETHTSPLLDATLCLSLSGRSWMWPLTQEFLERQTYPHGRTHLIIADTSQDTSFGSVVQSWLHLCDYEKHTYLPLSVGLPGLADLPRRTVTHEVAAACARIYAHVAPLCTTPWVFFLEDDILPPIDAYPQLLQHFTDRTVSVSALCMQRSGPHPVAWEWDTDGLPTEPSHQTGITAIGGNGFCCVALRGEYVRGGHFHCGPGSSCHDHNFYRTLVYEQGLQALLDWSCVCQHYMSPREWRAPSSSIPGVSPPQDVVAMRE